MKLKKTNLRPIMRPLNSKRVAIIWCDDGWSYIPLLKIRRKFEHGQSCIECTEEPWEDAIAAKVLYEEVLLWTEYSLKPRLWTEHGQAEDPMGFLDCFEEIA